jgi:FkbM family methyltransferase
MEIFFNTNPEFTQWMVDTCALHEAFVVIDVGVLGGESPRWQFLGDHLVVHGFDAIKEVIDDLSAKNKASNKSYHWFAIGNEDGEREFFFNPNNPTSSSFDRGLNPSLQSRTVPVRRLDTLFGQGVIPKADFIKIDVEGFEKGVLEGAAELLAAGFLGVESESHFSTSAAYPNTHFGLIQNVMLQHGMLVFDINFNRVPRAACQEARRRRNLPPLPLQEAGKPATLNVLFCRDLTAERDGSLYYPKLPPKPSVDQILKTMSIYELHGLNDIAVDTAIKFSSELGQRLDVERAVDLLCRRSNFLPGLEERISDLQCELARAASGRVQLDGEHIRELARLTSERDQLNGERIALTEEVSQMRASTSWRMTAPLRSLVHRFRQTMR